MHPLAEMKGKDITESDNVIDFFFLGAALEQN